MNLGIDLVLGPLVAATRALCKRDSCVMAGGYKSVVNPNQGGPDVQGHRQGKGSVMGKHQLAMPVLVAVLVAGAAACNAASPSASPSGATAPAVLVTEEVEPGVERIRSDGAGHDLEEKHPTFRYDMDDVYVTPDGTVWLSSTYSGTDNDANPPGGLVWALGKSETPQYPAAVFCFPGEVDKPEALGVTCFGSGRHPDQVPRHYAHQRCRGCTGWDLLGGGRRRGRERRSVPHHAQVTHHSTRQRRPVPQGEGPLGPAPVPDSRSRVMRPARPGRPGCSLRSPNGPHAIPLGVSRRQSTDRHCGLVADMLAA